MLGLLGGLFQASELSDPKWTASAETFLNLAAGEAVNDTNVLTLSAWYAALRNKAEDIGKLPIHVVEQTPDGETKRIYDHPVAYLFDTAPNSYQTPIVFRSQVEHWADGWGNGYAQIERDANMNPIALHPIHPGRVQVEWDDDTQRIVYKVLNRRGNLAGGYTAVDQDNMLHIRGLGSDPFVGYSVIRFAAESLSLSLAAERFGAAYFKNSGALSGIVKHPGNMGVEARNNFVSSFDGAYRGARKAGGWILLEDGMSYEQLSIPPEDAQFIQTRQLQIEEIARWLRMPPSKLMHLAKSSYNTLEMQNLEYVIDCLQPCAIRWEQECKRKLFRRDESNVFMTHNFNGLLRGDIKTQTEHIRTMANIGVYSTNESRKFLGMNSVGDAGDKRFIAGNMIELKEDMLFPADVKAQSRAPREPNPADTVSTETQPEKVQILSETQAWSIVWPIIERAQRKAEKAIPRIQKNHSDDADLIDSKIQEFITDLISEMVVNFAPVCEAFNVDAEEIARLALGADLVNGGYEELAKLLADKVRNTL
jgi:HK97 family phage portal protein